jgi:hypothetical protein
MQQLNKECYANTSSVFSHLPVSDFEWCTGCCAEAAHRNLQHHTVRVSGTLPFALRTVYGVLSFLSSCRRQRRLVWSMIPVQSSCDQPCDSFDAKDMHLGETRLYFVE